MTSTSRQLPDRRNRLRLIVTLLLALIPALLIELLANHTAFSTRHLEPVTPPLQFKDEVLCLTGLEDLDIQTLHLRLVQKDAGRDSAVPVQILMIDEGSYLGSRLPLRTLVDGEERSEWIVFHPAGRIKELRISLEPMSWDEVTIDALEFNAPRPFHVSLLRFLFVWGAAALLMNLKALAARCRRLEKTSGGRQKLLLAAIGLQAVILTVCACLAPVHPGSRFGRLTAFIGLIPALLLIPAVFGLFLTVRRRLHPEASYGRTLTAASFCLDTCGVMGTLLVPGRQSLLVTAVCLCASTGLMLILSAPQRNGRKSLPLLSTGLLFLVLAFILEAALFIPALGARLGLPAEAAAQPAVPAAFVLSAFAGTFALPDMSAVFPFFTPLGRTGLSTAPLVWEGFYGGALFLMPFFVLGFLSFAGRHVRRILRVMGPVLMACGVLLMGALGLARGVSVQTFQAGLWPFAMAAGLGLMAFAPAREADRRLWVVRLLLVLTAVSLFLQIFIVGPDILAADAPRTFAKVFYDLQFWL